MTSGTFHSIPISSITINREVRQRKDVSDVRDLVDSIKRLGLINPIVVTEDRVLVAGERRLTACTKIGWTNIPVQFTHELSEHELKAIELEENVKRKELPWQDECMAVLDYHNHRKSEDPEWTQTDTAQSIGYTAHYVSDKIRVALELIAGSDRVKDAKRFSTARGIVERKNVRQHQAAITALKAIINPTKADAPVDAILVEDFHKWAPLYEGPPFNFVHCDFPYGIGADKFAQGSADLHGGYSDKSEDYWALCNSLIGNIDRLCDESCHFVFWFSLSNYASTLDYFHSKSDIIFDPFPLVWLKSDNVGIIPDPVRGPRRVYETALFGSRGDRRIVVPKCNGYHSPTVRDAHMSIKPEPMLRYFFEMFVDQSTIFLDPTCGSGSSLRAAESLGAKVTGLEINKDFAEGANAAQNRMRMFLRAEKVRSS